MVSTRIAGLKDRLEMDSKDLRQHQQDSAEPANENKLQNEPQQEYCPTGIIEGRSYDGKSTVACVR